MTKEKSHEYIHSWIVFAMTFFTLLFLFFNKKFLFDLPLILFMMIVFLKNRLSLKNVSRIFFYSFIFSFSFFLISVLFPAKSLQTGASFDIYGFSLSKMILAGALKTMIRLFLISFFSMTSATTIDYTKVILYLISEKGLSVFWGYPMLLALNSISLFKKEFERIRINARLRNLPFKDKFVVFFPMLVFAIRHSQRGAISLVTRGLNEQKSFYYHYGLTQFDKLVLFLFSFAYLALLALIIFQTK
jgi:hypothetical protein